MKQLVKIFTITSVLVMSFMTLADKNNLSDADKDNSSDKKTATEMACDTQFGYSEPLGSTTENGQKINICPRI